MTGDLNLLWTDPALEPLRAILSDTRETAETTDAIGSFNAFLVPGGLWSIDFVLHDHGRVVRFETVDDDYGVSYISDHYPVVATIECGACG